MLIVALATAIILSFLSIRRYGKILNPFTLEAYITILFLIVPQLVLVIFDPIAQTYIYSDLVIITYLIFIYLGTLVNFKPLKLKEIKNASLINSFNIALYLIMVIPLFFFFLPFKLSFSSIRSFYETVVFSEYASLFELSKYLIYFIIVMRLFRVDKFDIITVGLCSLLLLYGSKYALFDLVVILFIYFEQFRRLSIRKFTVMVVITGSLFVSYRYYQSSGEENVFVSALSYFDLYKNQSHLVESLMKGDHEYYYGRVYFSSYLKYIPRAIWVDKPREFGFAILNYDFFPEYARNGYMPSFGLGSSFADFGFFSIAFFGFVAGVFRNFFYRTFVASRNNISFFLFAFPLNFITILFTALQIVMDAFVRIAADKPISTIVEKEQ